MTRLTWAWVGASKQLPKLIALTSWAGGALSAASSRLFCVLLVGLLAIQPSIAGDNLADNTKPNLEAFLEKAFAGLDVEEGPKQQVVWLNKATKKVAKEILGHSYAGLRVRYWAAGKRTAWILNEVGKELPITIGVAIEDGKIQEVTVLKFRESRGGEVRYSFFTDQFRGLFLTEEKRLSDYIDGITGATLSVRAVTRVARFALYLHQRTPYATLSQ